MRKYLTTYGTGAGHTWPSDRYWYLANADVYISNGGKRFKIVFQDGQSVNGIIPQEKQVKCHAGKR